MRQPLACVLVVAFCLLAGSRSLPAQSEQTLTIRGQVQVLRLYGPPDGQPAIVSSGDGGWIHLAPHVAEVLAGEGYFVVGFDARAYLSGFTSGASSLRQEDEPGDYLELAQFAARASHKKPVLVGVSEGAGLSVLAATDPRTKTAIAGVVGLGLPDSNELGWRTRDMLIYLTHGVPNEPAFSATAIAGKVSPLPLALIYSTRDEFVPQGQAQQILNAAGTPKQLWLVDAANHRFADRLPEFDARLLEAIRWVLQHTP